MRTPVAPRPRARTKPVRKRAGVDRTIASAAAARNGAGGAAHTGANGAAPGAPLPVAHTHAPGGTRGGETLGQCVTRHLEDYFAALDGARPHALHEMVLSAVELPLLQFAMARANGNQSAAAELLGINRNTLRKKLADYKLIP